MGVPPRGPIPGSAPKMLTTIPSATSRAGPAPAAITTLVPATKAE